MGNFDISKWQSKFLTESLTPEQEDKLQVTVGDYETQHFDVCPVAVSLYKDIEGKVENLDLAIRSAKLQDALFAIEKEVLEDGGESVDVYVAQTLADQIMAMADMMDLSKEHSYIQGHVDKIESTVPLSEGKDDYLCKRGKDYIKARKAAGEKSSAYLSGRAVKVCKGDIEFKGKKVKSYK